MRSRQPAGSTTTIARDHFPTIVEEDRRVRFPAAIAIHPDHGEAYDKVFRIPSRMTEGLREPLKGVRNQICIWFLTPFLAFRAPLAAVAPSLKIQSLRALRPAGYLGRSSDPCQIHGITAFRAD